jgi:ribosomal-protein-alanine N-acetyltransferase
MKVKLEKWRRTFIPAVAEYANNPKIAENLRDGFPQPYTKTDADQYVSDCIKKGDGEQLLRAVTADGACVGSIGVFPRGDGSAELGYWLGEPFWGRGIMADACAKSAPKRFRASRSAGFTPRPMKATFVPPGTGKGGFRYDGPTESRGCSRGPVCLYTLFRNREENK